MNDIERRTNKDRRSGDDRRKAPRRFTDVFPPRNSEDWKEIILCNIQVFADKYMISLSELKLLVTECINRKDKNGY